MQERTRTSYPAYIRQYEDFARTKGMPEEDEVTLAAFIKKRWEDGLSRSTLCSTIPAAVYDKFKFSSHRPSEGSLVKEVKEAVSKMTQPPEGMQPLPVDILSKMLQLLVRKGAPGAIRDGCILVVCFFGLLRESEAMQLRSEDVRLAQVGSTQVVEILVRGSKTDQRGEGATVRLAGDGTSIGCPVTWVKAFKEVRRPAEVFFFHKLEGGPLAVTTPYHIVKRVLKELGVDATSFGSHSLRKGGATAAVQGGVPVTGLKPHGRWKSDAVFTYIVLPKEELIKASAAILAECGKAQKVNAAAQVANPRAKTTGRPVAGGYKRLR